MAIDTIKSSAVFDGAIATADIADDAVTSAKLDTNIAVAGDLTVDTSTLKVDASNNRVGIGTASPGRKLELNNGGTGAFVTFTDGVATNFTFKTDGNQVGTFGTEAGSTHLGFMASGTERVRIHTGGVMSVNNGIELGSGLDATAANVLDDYEEGTFTPAYVSGITGSYQTQFGTYTKIGRLVYVEIHIDGNSMSGDSNQVKIGGLPFATQNASASNGGAYHVYTGGTYDGGNTVTWLFARNEAVVYAYNVSGAQFRGNQWSDVNGGYRIAGFYQAA